MLQEACSHISSLLSRRPPIPLPSFSAFPEFLIATVSCFFESSTFLPLFLQHPLFHHRSHLLTARPSLIFFRPQSLSVQVYEFNMHGRDFSPLPRIQSFSMRAESAHWHTSFTPSIQGHPARHYPILPPFSLSCFVSLRSSIVGDVFPVESFVLLSFFDH